MRRLLRNTLIQTANVIHLDDAMLGRLQRRVSRGERLILVVAMHDTLRSDQASFQLQLQWVQKHFTLISPDTFFALWDNSQPRPSWSKPAVLFTFDDGRENNYNVAAPILESMGAHGLFFVVPDFIGLSGQNARDFYYSKIDIRGLTSPQSAACDKSQASEPLLTNPELWTPMSPDQLADLTKRGHSIGNHTLSHLTLTGLSGSDLHQQIDSSAAKIASWTGKKVDAFAWPYAWYAINREAYDLITKTHRFCFAPCPGITNSVKDSPHLIWRTETEAWYSEPEYRFMYSGLIDPIWSGKRRTLKAMLQTVPCGVDMDCPHA